MGVEVGTSFIAPVFILLLVKPPSSVPLTLKEKSKPVTLPELAGIPK
jgi:hypothetical protein